MRWLFVQRNPKTISNPFARLAFLFFYHFFLTQFFFFRFEEVAFNPCGSFWICFEPKMLSPDTTYASYLVYKLHESHSGCEPPLEVSDVSKNNDPWYIYLLTPLTPIIGRKVNRDTHNLFSRPKRKGLPQQRKDGWMEVQVSEFRTGTATEEITKFLRLIRSSNILLKGLIVQGIEFKPL